MLPDSIENVTIIVMDRVCLIKGKNSDQQNEDDKDEENLEHLCKEAHMPLDQLIDRYRKESSGRFKFTKNNKQLKNWDKDPNSHSILPWPSLLLRAMDKLLMRKTLFQHLNDRGIQIYIWVLNYEEDFKRAFELGATGVMTDYPSRLQKFLLENPQFRTYEMFS